MDYEKEYKSLVAKVKKAHQFAQTDSTKNVLEDILPSLRESEDEDERTRKRLIEFISDIKRISESGRRSWAVRKDDVEMCDAFLSYLEKQKELPFVKDVMLGYPGLYFYDGERMHFRGPAMEEKQKEQKPTEWSYPYGKNETVDRLVSIAECLEMNGDCVYNGYKGDECGVFLRALAREYLCIEELVNVVQDKNLMDILYYASSDDHFPSLRKLHTLLTSYNEQKEQNPCKDSGTEGDIMQYIEEGEKRGVKEVISFPEKYGLQKKHKPADYCSVRDEFDLDGNLKQNPAEWSEEDEDIRDTIIRDLKHLGGDIANVKPAYKTEVDWLKALPERFNLQPKQEWSEEDERMVRFYADDYDNNLGNMSMRDVIENRIKFKDWLLNRLKFLRPQSQKLEEWTEEDERMWKSALWHIKNSCGNGGKNSGEFEVYQWFENRLKSLRPQPNLSWSDEDEKVYNKALDALYYKDLNNKDDVLSALKGLCDLISKKRKVIPPYSRWKPSKAQKEAVQRAIDCLDGEYNDHPEELDSLLKDLEKLM